MIEPEVLLQGYRLGVFPMAMADGAIEWFSPIPARFWPLKEFHVPHTVERAVRKGVFEIASMFVHRRDAGMRAPA